MIHHVESQVLVLLLIASLVGMAARRMRVPYTLALVLTGLLLGFAHLPALHGIAFGKDLLLLLFLPALLFEAALHIDPRELRRDIAPILTLAVPGVLVAVSVTAALMWAGLGLTGLAPGIGWGDAFLFASVIAATDPVSVLALFKELGVPRRLYLLVESESLLNDGVAVVVFVIVGAVLGLEGEAPLQGIGEIASYGIGTFVWMAGGGALLGLVIGGAVSLLMRHIDDHLIEVTLTTIVAYGSFLLAEQVHASGVLSTVTAGIVMGSLGRSYGMSVSTRIATEDFWEYMAFLANSFVFLLVGLELEPMVLLTHAPAIAVAFVAVVLARAAAVYGLLPAVGRLSAPIPRIWRLVMVWGGLRGSLSMVLVITLPMDWPARTLLINLVFGVVATSLFLQGLTVGPLLRRLGVLGERQERERYELARLQAITAREGAHALGAMKERLDPRAREQLNRWYAARADTAEREAADLAGADVLDEQLVEGLQELLDVEREAIRHALTAGLVSAKVASQLDAELDERRESLTYAHNGETERRGVLKKLLG